jgi:hypothetical protein
LAVAAAPAGGGLVARVMLCGMLAAGCQCSCERAVLLTADTAPGSSDFIAKKIAAACWVCPGLQDAATWRCCGSSVGQHIMLTACASVKEKRQQPQQLVWLLPVAGCSLVILLLGLLWLLVLQDRKVMACNSQLFSYPTSFCSCYPRV